MFLCSLQLWWVWVSFFQLLIIVHDCSLIKGLCLSQKSCLATYCLSLWLWTAWTHENFTHVTCLSPQGGNCLGFWIKLGIAWDFIYCLFHLSVLFSILLGSTASRVMTSSTELGLGSFREAPRSWVNPRHCMLSYLHGWGLVLLWSIVTVPCFIPPEVRK